MLFLSFKVCIGNDIKGHGLCNILTLVVKYSLPRNLEIQVLYKFSKRYDLSNEITEIWVCILSKLDYFGNQEFIHTYDSQKFDYSHHSSFLS